MDVLERGLDRAVRERRLEPTALLRAAQTYGTLRTLARVKRAVESGIGIGDALREEARDVVQVTFLRLWENRRKFDDRWSPNTWIYRIATNLAIDVLYVLIDPRVTIEA